MWHLLYAIITCVGYHFSKCEMTNKTHVFVLADICTCEMGVSDTLYTYITQFYITSRNNTATILYLTLSIRTLYSSGWVTLV